MKEVKADLHLHSEQSDGSLSPSNVVQLAWEAELDLIALTDHDTVGGVKEAVERGKELGGITVLAGIELSSYDREDVHILGYNVPYLDEKFLRAVEDTQGMRYDRYRLTTEKLNKIGIDVTMQDAENEAKGDVVGRVHMARVIVKKGYCSDMVETIEKYLLPGCPTYVGERSATPVEAVKLIRDFGGVAALAHPHRFFRPFFETEALVFELKRAGLQGIESEYFSHAKEQRDRFRALAKKYSLINTGGSDFHCTYYGRLNKYFAPDSETLRVLGVVEE